VGRVKPVHFGSKMREERSIPKLRQVARARFTYVRAKYKQKDAIPISEAAPRPSLTATTEVGNDAVVCLLKRVPLRALPSTFMSLECEAGIVFRSLEVGGVSQSEMSEQAYKRTPKLKT
jgi:hypothetical protein